MTDKIVQYLYWWNNISYRLLISLTGKMRFELLICADRHSYRSLKRLQSYLRRHSLRTFQPMSSFSIKAVKRVLLFFIVAVRIWFVFEIDYISIWRFCQPSQYIFHSKRNASHWWFYHQNHSPYGTNSLKFQKPPVSG